MYLCIHDMVSEKLFQLNALHELCILHNKYWPTSESKRVLRRQGATLSHPDLRGRSITFQVFRLSVVETEMIYLRVYTTLGNANHNAPLNSLLLISSWFCTFDTSYYVVVECNGDICMIKGNASFPHCLAKDVLNVFLTTVNVSHIIINVQ